jgi:polar amino acid transport system substrate-binding protein
MIACKKHGIKEEIIMKKRLISIALASVMALSLAGCGGSAGGTTTEADTSAPADTTAQASSEDTTAADDTSTEAAKTAADAGGTLIVGFDQDFPPMGFIGNDGEFTGFDLELAQEVAKRLGLEYKPQPIAWDAKDMELEAGNIDCIWNGFTMTGREDDYAWTEAYMANTQVFVVAKDSGIASQADLAGKVVECQVDSSAEAALKEVPDLTATFKDLLTTADYNTAFMDLEQGAVDAIAMDVIVAGYQIQQRNADFVILDDSLSAEEYGVGFKKDNTELRDKVQKTLEEMAADGTLKGISEKWFGEDVTTIGK